MQAASARTFLGRALGFLARAWLWTLRVEVRLHPELESLPTGVPWVLCFWHGTQWPLLAWRRRRETVVLVSLSRDGSLQAGALASIGLRVVRGSSSRGGARGLAGIIRKMKRGADAAFAVDGPRGPIYEVKEGAIAAASNGGGVLVPMGAACESARVFERAWDKYCLAWPFSRVVVVLGAPVDPGASDVRARLKEAIMACNGGAKAALLPGDVSVGNYVGLAGK